MGARREYSTRQRRSERRGGLKQGGPVPQRVQRSPRIRVYVIHPRDRGVAMLLIRKYIRLQPELAAARPMSGLDPG